MKFGFLNRKGTALLVSAAMLVTLFAGTIWANAEIGTNLVANPAFGNGIESWEKGNADSRTENTDPVDGSDYAYIPAGDWGDGLNQKINGLTPGDYTLEYDYKGSSNVWFGANDYDNDAGGINNEFKESLDEWEHIKIDFTLTASAPYFTLRLMGDKGDAMFDNINLYRTSEEIPVTEPTAAEPTAEVPNVFDYSLEEDFDYANGAISNQNGGTGWNKEWYVQSDSPVWAVDDATPLGYANLKNSPSYFSGGGSYLASGRFIWDRNASVPDDMVKYCNDNNLLGKPGQTIWISTLYRQNANTEGYLSTYDGTEFPESAFPNGGIESRTKHNIVSFGSITDSNAKKWGFMSNGQFASTGKDVTLGETVFLVMKYEFTEDNKTNITMYVNPALGTEEPQTAYTAAMTVDKLQGFKAFSFIPGNGAGDGAIDGLRMGGSYEEVSPIDESKPVPTETAAATPTSDVTPTSEVTTESTPTDAVKTEGDLLEGFDAGFENSTVGQKPTNFDFGTVVDTQKHGGNHSLSIPGKQWTAFFVNKEVAKLLPNHNYRLTAWVKNDTASPELSVQVLYRLPGATENSNFVLSVNPASAGDWTEYSVEFTTPGSLSEDFGGDGNAFGIGIWNANDVIYIDDISLVNLGEQTATPTPTATATATPTATPTATAKPTTTTTNVTGYVPVSKVEIAKVVGKVTATTKVNVYKKASTKRGKYGTISKNKTVTVRSIKGLYAKVKYGKKTGYVKVTSLKFSKYQTGKVLSTTRAYKKASTKNGYHATFAKNKRFTVKGRYTSYYKTTVKITVQKK